MVEDFGERKSLKFSTIGVGGVQEGIHGVLYSLEYKAYESEGVRDIKTGFHDSRRI